MIILRLTLDISLTKDNIVCSELERIITAVLEEIPEESIDQIVRYYLFSYDWMSQHLPKYD